MKNLNLTICGALSLVEKVKATAPDLVISFAFPRGASEELIDSPRLSEELADPTNAYYSKHLGDLFWLERQHFIEVDDVEYPEHDRHTQGRLMLPPSFEQVAGAIHHFKQFAPTDRVPNVVVNCAAGRSRSTALGLVLLAYTHPDKAPDELVAELLKIRPIATPNRAIVAHGDKHLGLGGSLLKAIDLTPNILDNRVGITRSIQPPLDFWQKEALLPRYKQLNLTNG